MANEAAGLLSYAALLAFGNPITNLVSIGGNSPLTGIVPGYESLPQGGFSTPSSIEGQLSDWPCILFKF